MFKVSIHARRICCLPLQTMPQFVHVSGGRVLLSTSLSTKTGEEDTCQSYKLDMAEHNDETCYLYVWKKRFPFFRQIEHVALETHSGTYISIRPAHIEGFRPHPVMINRSLEEDNKDKQKPTRIELCGLNAKGIDNWYETLDKTPEFEGLTEDYSWLSTALSMGSTFFKQYFTEKTNVNPEMICNAAGRYEQDHEPPFTPETAAAHGD